MKMRSLCSLFASSLALCAAEPADIELTTGHVLKSARIVTMGERLATIVHSGGSTSVPLEHVPLDVLARARIANEDKEAARKQRAEEAAKAAEDRAAEAETAHHDEIRLRLATANMRAVAQGGERVEQPKARPPSSRPSRTATPASLAELKERFPRRQTRTVGFLKNKKYYLAPATTTTTQIDGNTITSVRQRTPSVTVSGRPDTMSIEVPHPDVYSYYKGMVQTATMEGLPRTLKMIEDRLETDLDRLAGQTGSYSDTLNAAQAQASIDWINRSLRPYLGQLRALAGR
ncbi:MAG: hypothetical protein FJ399_20880 [Verrucomicrobia bacterium]|nr:hypothetical protein [Verrucomicrobiota bacterium]